MTTTHLSERGASTLWIVLLAAASAVTSLALACAAPFAALAALAALHMRRRDGIALAVLAWGINQAIGFGVKHYPTDPKTLAWGVGIGTAAVASAIAAHAVVAALRERHFAVRTVAAYAAAFVAFKGTLTLWALVLGGLATALSTKVMATQLPRDGAILLGLLALYHGLVAIGVPAPMARARRAQLA